MSANPSESQRVVWYVPTDYNALKHGPPYLPLSEAVKLSSEQRAGIKTQIKQAAFYDAPPIMDPGASSSTHLTQLLGLLQALAMLHQVHHWNTKGSAYYADHLLFERLYNDSVGFIDGLAEKALGLKETVTVVAVNQAQIICELLASFGQGVNPDEMVSISLQAEIFCLACIAKVLDTKELQGTLSHGLSNMLEGVADKHEEFVYLLQQRGQAYSYDRR